MILYIRHLRFFMLWMALFTSADAIAQLCATDSNYYSVRYNTQNNIFFTNGIITPQNELVALCQNSTLNSSFVTKFTAQGNVIWSNEYIPDYPYVSWLQLPWYTNTHMTGILNSADSGYYVYGSSTEHGRTINNVEDPPTHQVGLLLNIDKFGKAACSYFGNWRTDYEVAGVTGLADGGLVVYLRSSVPPYKSKVVCINKSGEIIWGIPLQLTELYSEISTVNPVMKQLRNGNIVIASEIRRSIDDTIHFPFLDVIVPGPLVLFNILVVKSNDGKVINHTSYECAALAKSNLDPDYIPRIKSITELPDGNLSFCADAYWLADKSLVFYDQTIFTKRAVNFITDNLGIYTGVITYALENNSCTLQNTWQTATPGEQVLLVKDSTNQQLVLFAIDNKGKVEWTKAYSNPVNTKNSEGIFLQKKNNAGYSIFQADPSLHSFELIITNSIGGTTCAELPAVKIVADDQVWAWPVNRVQYADVSFDMDFRYGGFDIVQKPVPITMETYCKYQFECCKDVIDTLNPHNISICEGETYTLPDSSVVNVSGSYYQTLKTTRGCDSVVFYHVQVIKSPSHLTAPADTCLNDSSTIKLHATGGYETYLWNNEVTSDSTYLVKAPGIYPVKVTNRCGTKTDTVQVYQKCDFPIYFPNAFTPNGDQLNDVLRVPWANNNKLVRLRIYNRYGQKIFSETDIKKGWDGTYKGMPQAVGAYTYILEMKGLSGKKQDQKGTVLLLR
ncbi:MAG: gliding motility-associated C-terminal domain-containing protein [Ginsengibacter sp.]